MGEVKEEEKGESVLRSYTITQQLYMRHSLQGDGESFVRVASVSGHVTQEHLQETDMRGAVMTHQCLQR